MRVFLRLLTIFFVLNALSACSHTFVRNTSDYRDILKKDQKLLVLVPEVEVNTVSTLGDKTRMYDFEYHVRDALLPKITDDLVGKGYRAKQLHVQEMRDKEIYRNVAVVNENFIEQRVGLYSTISNKDIEKAGDIDVKLSQKALEFAQEISEKTQSELLIISHYDEVIKTSGARAASLAMDVLIGGGSSHNGETATLVIGIVEAKTGRILWTHAAVDVQSIWGAFGSDESVTNKKLDAVVLGAFGKLPTKDQLYEPVNTK